MAGTFKRGGARGGGFKKSFNKKRSSPDDDDTGPRTSKKAKNDEASDDDAAPAVPFVPTLDEDDEKNQFISIRSTDKANGLRRVTVSEFKKTTLISIREYYKDDNDKMKPGKKGIALTMEQYNNLVASLPLLESVLRERGEDVVRPDYDAQPAPPVKDEDGEDAPVDKADDDGDDAD